MELDDRWRQLDRLARQRGIDSQEKVADLPDDMRLRTAALATVLGLDAHQAAIAIEAPLDMLTSRPAMDQDTAEEYARDIRDAIQAGEGE